MIAVAESSRKSLIVMSLCKVTELGKVVCNQNVFFSFSNFLFQLQDTGGEKACDFMSKASGEGTNSCEQLV